MHLAFVSFYNNAVGGPRSIAAYLKPLGHRSRFIHLKAMYLIQIPRLERDRIDAILEAHPRSGIMAFEEGDVITPNPVPITKHEEELFLENLTRDTPDYVGFNVHWSGLQSYQRFSNLVREFFPRLKILAGGPPAISAPEHLFPHADVVCTGEGEEALTEWLEDPERTDVVGLWFRRNGRIIKNPRRPLLENLDRLPIAVYGEDEILIEDDAISRKLETDLAYLRDHWVFMSQRGCPLQCSYCHEGQFAKLFPQKGRLPRRSADHFVKELSAAARRLPFEHMTFWDSIFVKDEEWLEEFAQKYRQEVDLPFFCHGYPGFSTRRALEIVKGAGADHVAFALQSGNRETNRRYYGRWVSKKALRRTITDAQEVGIEHVTCDLIVNSCFDNEQALRETFDFLISLPKPVPLFLTYLFRFPGIPISEMTPPDDAADERTHYFFNVLFHLTRFPKISRKGLRAISVDPLIRRYPDILDEFLGLYVKRMKYLGKPVWLYYRGREPEAWELGSLPGLRLLLQRRFPRAYMRAKILKRRLLGRLGLQPKPDRS